MLTRMVMVLGFGVAACQSGNGSAEGALDWTTVQDSTDRVASVTGFMGPEAVRFDPEADVFFVSNFNGSGGERDANGFISRVSAEGSIEELEFAVGTELYPLHAPRGMYIQADTLWVADADGVHGFDRRSGDQLSFADFTSFEPGFLNDVAAGPGGALYVTDTGRSRIYRLAAGQVTIAVEDSLLGPPNGITWYGTIGQFLLAPWQGQQQLRAWNPATGELTDFVESPGGFFDGIEVVDGNVIVASQADSSLHVFSDRTTRQIVKLPGRPADIGIDRRRTRVAVPYVALNQVDIWQLPVN